jgi:PKD repeat protein
MGGNNFLGTYGQRYPDDFPADPLKSDVTAGHQGQMAAWSSRGPTDDDRIKPDVVAPGTWVLSNYSGLYQEGYGDLVNPQNGVYQWDGWGMPFAEAHKYMGGTSMSCPLVAGGAAVVRDFYQEAHSHAASAALVKATLINSAVDMLDENNDGVDDNDYPIPNDHEGWGRVNLVDATDGSHQFVDETTGLGTNGTATYQFNIETSGAPFKVTLVWSDYPSTEAASKNLVNDLDLVVTSPSGTVYQGNVFGGGWSQTGGSADRINNVENVYLESAESGTWTVEVKGYSVANGPQPFALVVDGTFGNAPPVASFTYSCTDLTCDFDGSDSYDPDGTIVSYDWDFGDNETGSGVTVQHTYPAEDTYTVVLTVTDNDGATGTDTQDVTVGTQPTMHVGDLDGSSVPAPRNRWEATVTIEVHDGAHAPLLGATVTGTWSVGGSSSCTTGADGRCSVTKGNLKSNLDSVTFTVDDVTLTGYSYEPGDNHDPDGDSDGTIITVYKP